MRKRQIWGEVFVHRGSSGTSDSEAQSLPWDGVC